MQVVQTVSPGAEYLSAGHVSHGGTGTQNLFWRTKPGLQTMGHESGATSVTPSKVLEVAGTKTPLAPLVQGEAVMQPLTHSTEPVTQRGVPWFSLLPTMIQLYTAFRQYEPYGK